MYDTGRVAGGLVSKGPLWILNALKYQNMCFPIGVVGRQAVVFGGREREGRLSDLHTLDMDTMTWHW